jgi:hypothetical protein
VIEKKLERKLLFKTGSHFSVSPDDRTLVNSNSGRNIWDQHGNNMKSLISKLNLTNLAAKDGKQGSNNTQRSERNSSMPRGLNSMNKNLSYKMLQNNENHHNNSSIIMPIKPFNSNNNAIINNKEIFSAKDYFYFKRNNYKANAMLNK